MPDRAGRSGTLKVGSRGSLLAMAQAHLFVQRFRDGFPDWSVEIVRISTRGDRVLDRPLAAIGGKALFVEEIEQAVRSGAVDVAVHSAKDVPSTIPDDMELAAYLPRADVRDALVSNGARVLSALSPGARVGTSSPRRTCQLRAMRPDLTVLDIRGNVDTRLAKLDRGEYDAIVLAAAGLERLGLGARVTEYLDASTMVPCAGQGAIAIEVTRDSHIASMMHTLNDAVTGDAVTAERAFARRVNGTCDSPVAAHATCDGDHLTLTAMLGHVDGRFVASSLRGDRVKALEIGAQLAAQLLADGGAALLGRAGADASA